MGATGGRPWLADAGRGSAKILVVDDRKDKLLAFQAILQELEQDIFTAGSGDEALKLVLEHDFAVILLDVNMPGLDGLETAALIRQRKKSAHTPIIFITAYSDEMLTMQGYSLGAVDYILSPVVPDILRTKVRVFVDLFCLTESAKQQMEERIALAREQTARAAAEEASRRSTLLSDASRALTGALDVQARIQDLFSVVVPSLADLCSFTYLDEHDGIERTDLAWVMAGQPLRRTSPGSIPPALARDVERALATSKPQTIENNRPSASLNETGLGHDSDESGRLPPICSGAIFPLSARGRMVGVLGFALCSADRLFNKSDWLLLEDLANRAAVAVDNALLYQQLQTADRHKNDFLAMLGHELRNPLAPIRNAVELLRIAGSDTQRRSRAQDVIERQVKHLTRLVDDLLDVSRITRGKIELQCSPLQISGVISNAVEISMPLIESRKHRLSVSVPPQPLWINADSGRLAQVLANLLNNAAKYTPEGGSISLSVGQEEHNIVFRVVDTGVGLSRQMLSKIFDLFGRDEGPRSSFHDGLGVGLMLVRRLVELHGGKVDAFSAGANKGSEFVVRVPVFLEDRATSARPVTAKAQAAPPPRGVRVLVVDDNQDAAESTSMLLHAFGFEVQTVYDGAAALDKFSDFHPDAVLLDIGMPMMDGYEVARRLRARPSGDGLAIIAVSGYGQDEDRRRSMEAGFDSHMTKPLDTPRLIEILNSLGCTHRNGKVS